MPGDSGVTVVTNARAFYTPRAAAGASGARHSLRPLIEEGGTLMQNSREMRGEIAKLWLGTESFAQEARKKFYFRHSPMCNCTSEDAPSWRIPE
jgi:hypothetical protein